MPKKDHVLTPGGWKHRSLVHHVPHGHRVRVLRNRLHLVDAKAKIVAELGETPFHPPGRPLLPRSRAEMAARRTEAGSPVPSLGDGWIIYSSWTNDTGTPVSRFATTWTVPPEPRTHNSQTIFLFNGIQNSTMIYQPVLQWGQSAAGGGSHWSVASWYADGQTGHSFHSDLVNVEVGDVITGIMTRTGSGSTGHNYSCEFSGIAHTTLPIDNVEELTWCIETLEVYGVDHASDYPDTLKTAMRDIDIRCGTVTPDFLWTISNRVTDIGQHALVFNERVGGAGEVDLWYRPGPYWNSGFGSISAGSSQDWWFSWGGNGDVGPQLIQAEPVEPSGQLVTTINAESVDTDGHVTYHATVRNTGSSTVHFRWRGGGR